MSKLIVEAITEHYGERCPDFDAECFCCKAWAEYDRLACHEPTRCDELETVATQVRLIGDDHFRPFKPLLGEKLVEETREIVTRQNAEEVIAAERLKLEATARVGLQLTTQIEALEADNKRLREALEAMLVPYEGSDCRRDHHGYCQEHYLEEDCCVAKARAVLGEVKP